MAKVDQICDEVAQIEQTVLLLDDYTMRLVGLCLFLPLFGLCRSLIFLFFLKEAKFVSASPTSSTAASPAKK